jgi:hypothetical protein
MEQIFDGAVNVTKNRALCDEFINMLRIMFAQLEPTLGTYFFRRRNAVLSAIVDVNMVSECIKCHVCVCLGDSADSRVGGRYVGFTALFVLFYNVYKDVDKKFFRQVWDTYKKVNKIPKLLLNR